MSNEKQMNETQLAALEGFTSALLKLLAVAGPKLDETAARAISDGLKLGHVKLRVDVAPSRLKCSIAPTNSGDDASAVVLLDLTQAPINILVSATTRPN
jgi:hypothetical protein